MYKPWRIPLPPRETGNKRRSRAYHVRRRPIRAVTRLFGRSHADRLRGEMRRDAGLIRSPVRWVAASVFWIGLLWVALIHPFTRTSFVPLAAVVLGCFSLSAAFSRSGALRAFLSGLLLAVAVLYLNAGGAIGPGICGTVGAAVLLLGAGRIFGAPPAPDGEEEPAHELTPKKPSPCPEPPAEKGERPGDVIPPEYEGWW